MIEPLPSKEALDRYFLEARCKLLDVAGILDRIDRGGKLSDPRLEKIRTALGVLEEEKAGRAERIQQVFSLEYDPQWTRPGIRT